MTPDDVKARVNALRVTWEQTQDEERCHAIEDGLYQDVLEAIAGGPPSFWGAELAREALKTAEIRFPRHCA